MERSGGGLLLWIVERWWKKAVREKVRIIRTRRMFGERTGMVLIVVGCWFEVSEWGGWFWLVGWLADSGHGSGADLNVMSTKISITQKIKKWVTQNSSPTTSPK